MIPSHKSAIISYAQNRQMTMESQRQQQNQTQNMQFKQEHPNQNYLQQQRPQNPMGQTQKPQQPLPMKETQMKIEEETNGLMVDSIDFNQVSVMRKDEIQSHFKDLSQKDLDDIKIDILEDYQNEDSNQ